MNEVAMVIAYVRPAQRAVVSKAIRELNLSGWTESEATGHGEALDGRSLPRVRFEVLVPLERAAECAAQIGRAAHTGVKGDGLVLTLPVLGVARISNLSVGVEAV